MFYSIEEGPLGFCEGVLGQDTSESQPSIAKTLEIHEYVGCLCDMTEIMLKGA